MCPKMHGACCFLCEFCPDPGKHIGQPWRPELEEEEPDFEEFEIDAREYVWDVGTGGLRRCHSCKQNASYWKHGLCKNEACAWGLAVVEHVLCVLFPGTFDHQNFHPSNFDPSNFAPSNFDPSNFDPSNSDPSNSDPSNSEGSEFEGSAFEESKFEGSKFDGAQFEG